ncbi:MAG: LamG-like jellyroll fold domain-containing protein [Armatimonadota bacterium]
MKRLIRVCVIVGCLLLIGVVAFRYFHHPSQVSSPVQQPAVELPLEFSHLMYDCTLTLTPQASLTTNSAVHLLLEAGQGKDGTEIIITSREIQVVAVRKKQRTPCGKAAMTFSPGKSYRLRILRRGQRLGILDGETLLFAGKVPPADGTKSVLQVGEGWKAESEIQAREPVAFADDFMRTADEPGAWHVRSGAWALASSWDEDPHGNAQRFANAIFAQNAFAWHGRSPKGTAWCTAGDAAWDDYTFTAAVYPGKTGSVGLAVNMTDPQHGYFVRWAPANDHSTQGNRLELLRLEGGKTSRIAESAGGYVPGQWYQLAVESSLEGLRVSIDGRQRLATSKVTPLHGGVGLYVEGSAGATFDDITVYGSTLQTHLLAETAQLKIARGFIEDAKGMKQWVHTSGDWQEAGNGLRVNRHDFYGDHWMVLTARPDGADGRLVMRLNGNETDESSGCRAEITTSAATNKVTYTLYRDTRELASKTGEALHTGEEYAFRFRTTGKRLLLQRDGDAIVEAEDTAPITGRRPAYLASGGFSATQDVLVLGSNYRDYTFATAPVDWIGEGTWMATMRWACQPKWSFYSGWSRGDAVLWHKYRITGDQSLQAYSGFKMEYPREHLYYDQHSRFHDAGITICSDGHDPRSGYAVVSGLPDAQGNANARTVLYRNGVVVKESATSISGWGGNHFTWYDMELRKRGANIEFLLAGEPVIQYRDPHPINGGVPAIWTTDNGLSIARVRIHGANPPAPRTDPHVFLDDPWFPEWADMGKPLPLDFPQAFSTTGKPIQLAAVKRLAPAGTELPVAAGMRVTFTPGKPGDYWYQIRATDGQHASPAFNLFLPVYNPALRRDDSHALLLYRFDEKTGTVIYDRSAVSPQADLHIPEGAVTCWLPAHGLMYRGPKALEATAGTNKLMAIKRSRACTIEFWTSIESAHPATHWLGSLLTWASNTRKRNFQVGMHVYTLIFAPPSGKFQRGPTIDNFPTLDGSFTTYALRTGLQHIVITWDGATTRAYANGVLKGTGTTPWETNRWVNNAPLLVGNQADGERNYLGTFYLIAVHDKCFTPAEVVRHYQAGPSAK